MKILDHFEQSSPEWKAARAGKVTASRAKDARSRLKSGLPSSEQKKYAAQIAVGMRARVQVFDKNPARLEELDREFNGRLETVGTSEQGRALPLVLLAHGARFDATKPTLMLVAQQHGNEPAPGEAILVLLERWSAPENAQLLR